MFGPQRAAPRCGGVRGRRSQVRRCYRGVVPECGWTQVYSNKEELCPSGRWGQMHHDIIQPAETSEVIGLSPIAPQAFVDESAGARALGWQFHPELTLRTFQRWLTQRYSGSEHANPAATLAEASHHARDAGPRAAALFRAAPGISVSRPKNHSDRGRQQKRSASSITTERPEGLKCRNLPSSVESEPANR